MIESNEREANGFRKQNLNASGKSEDQEENRRMTKTKLNFVVFYLIAHIIVALLLALLIYGIINGGKWDGMMFVLLLGLSVIAVFEVIIWTRSGSGEGVINARYPWIAAIILTSIMTAVLMVRTIP